MSAARKQSAAIWNAESLMASGQARDGGAVHDMATFDRDDLSGRYHLDGMHSPAFDGARAALGGLRGNPRPEPGGIVVISGRHTTILAHAG